MMGNKQRDSLEKQSFSKPFFVLSALLLVVVLYAVLDEGYFRQTWRHYQSEFNEYEQGLIQKQYDELKAKIEVADKRKNARYKNRTVDELPNEPKKLSYKHILLKLEKAEIARETRNYKDLKKSFDKKSVILQDLQEKYRRAVEKQERIYSRWKRNRRLEKPYEKYVREYERLEGAITIHAAELQAARRQVDEARRRLRPYDGEVEKWMKAKKAYYAFLDEVSRKIDEINGRRPEIKELVAMSSASDTLSEAKVDRCISCHVAIDRKGFENADAPFATHPHYDELLLTHPISKFGCTTCHEGQGDATQIRGEPFGSGDLAHGYASEWKKPVLRGDFVQSSCHKCHANQWLLKHAPVAIKGKHLYMERGCIACHDIDGYKNDPMAGPSLEKMAAKIIPEWVVAWIQKPHSFDHHTEMPQAPLNENQLVEIASYLFQNSDPYKMPFGSYPENGDQERGEELFRTVGCYGCHRLEGKGNTFAPALDRIAEKTGVDWIYNWIQDPKSFNPSARMPRMRLKPQEAADITAYLATKGEKASEDEALRTELNNSQNKNEGYRLANQYGCYACHAIKGTGNFTKHSVDLTTIATTDTEKIDFGDTDIPQTWEDWIFNKIKTPQVFLHKKSTSRMPQHSLTDEETHALVVFLKGLQGETPPPQYIPSALSERQRKIDEGRRLIHRFNCTGCHKTEGEGGKIGPDLFGEGAKVQPSWLFRYLKDPGRVKVRPWLKARMPNFDFTDEMAEKLVDYFAALDGRGDVFVTVPKEKPSPKILTAGKSLVSPRYFNCFSCHARAKQTSLGPQSTRGPDLLMVPKRIRPDFIVPWILNPVHFIPGVRMPAVLSEGEEGSVSILNGNRNLQAEIIKTYLLNMKRDILTGGKESQKKKLAKKRRKRRWRPRKVRAKR